jgi:hypothetical protein
VALLPHKQNIKRGHVHAAECLVLQGQPEKKRKEKKNYAGSENHSPH